MDHSPLKVVAGTDAGPMGQPWLSLLIDYYSRMVVGFCLGFEPPSYAVIMEALRHAILPKSYLKERYPGGRGRGRSQAGVVAYPEHRRVFRRTGLLRQPRTS
jgi:hypothetical protein